MLPPKVEAPAPDVTVVGEDVIVPQADAAGGEEAGEEERVNSVE